MPIDGEGVRIRRDGMRGDDESPQHAGMIVANLLEEVVLDDRLRLGRGDGEMRGRHPIDEVALEHRGVAGDDAAPLLRSEPFGIRQRDHDVVDGPVDVFLERRGQPSRVAQHRILRGAVLWPVARYRAQERLPKGYVAPTCAPTRGERNFVRRAGPRRPPNGGGRQDFCDRTSRSRRSRKRRSASLVTSARARS